MTASFLVVFHTLPIFYSRPFRFYVPIFESVVSILQYVFHVPIVLAVIIGIYSIKENNHFRGHRK